MAAGVNLNDDQRIEAAMSVARLRALRGYTQRDLAHLAGITARTVSNIETCTTCPSPATLAELAHVFGTTVDRIIGGIR